MSFFEAVRRQFTLTYISGIPVRADMRWLFVIMLVTVVIAAGIEQAVGNFLTSMVLGLSATLVFFVSIFIHEFAHAAVARMEGLRVVEIVLHPFGGLTRFLHEPETPRAEFLIAIAGPAASFLLSVVFVAGSVAASSTGLDVLAIIFFTLAIGNFLIAVFNMFPGYPLDGGRVLRAWLWSAGRDLDEATILTGRCGQAIAILMTIFGLLIAIFFRDFFTGFWAALVGLFLYDSAKRIIAEVKAMQRVTVESLMMLPPAVSPDITLQEFIDGVLPLNRQRVFPVARDKRLYGMLMLEELAGLDRSRWSKTTVKEVMRVVTSEYFVDTETPLADARELVRRNGVGAVGVVDYEGRLVGMIYGN